MSADETVRPTLRIVRGDASAEDIAVLTALLSAAGGGESAPAPKPWRGSWADPFDMHQRPWQNGPGGWRASSRW